MILAVFAVTSILQVIQIWVWMEQSGSDVERYQTINLIFGGKLFISCMLIAPSLLYVCLYFIIYAFTLVIGFLLLQQRDLETS